MTRVINRAAPARPATTSGSKTLAQKVAAVTRWRESLNPLQGLTLQRGVQLAADYFRGDMADLQWAYFFIEQTDADLLALLELRFGRLLEMDWQIRTMKDADKTLAEEQQAFLQEKFDRIDNLYEAIEHLGMAAFRGFAHCEKWLRGGDLVHLEIVDQWNAVRDGLVGGWKYNADARSVSYCTLGEELVMPPEDFLYREVRRPINRIALYKFIRSNLNEVDWDAFNRIYGVPSGVVIGPPDVPSDKEEEYESSANEIAEGGSGYLPYQSQYVQNKSPGGTNPFKERLDHLTEKLILAGTCGKLTMLTDATGLGSGASDKQGEVLDSVVSADARRISERFQKQLAQPWLAEAFPGKPQVAWFALAADEKTDVSQIITDIKTLSDAGYIVDLSQVQEKTGYTVTLKPAPAPALGLGADALAAGAPPVIANRATPGAAGMQARFEANARALLSAAQLVTLKPAIDLVSPIRAEIARLDGLGDAAFSAGMAALRPQMLAAQARLPALERQILTGHPELEQAFTDIIGTAFMSGAAEGEQTRQIENKAPVSRPTVQRPPRPSKRAPGGP